MPLSTELIVQISDLDRISFECPSCRARVEVSAKATRPHPNPSATDQEISEALRKRQSVPAACPSCSADWNGLRESVRQFYALLEKVSAFGVTFRTAKGSVDSE